MRKNIIISGFGGQGIILMGIMLAKLAEAYPELNVAQAQNYGPASRGGSCRTDVVFSTERIDYPKSEEPDVMIFMSQSAVDKYICLAAPDKTLVVYDSTLVPALSTSCKTLPVPATEKAEDELGSRMVANMFLLGVICETLVAGCSDTLCRIITENVRPKFREINERAFKSGVSYRLRHM